MKLNSIHRHFMMFKPYGVLSQFESNAKHEQRKTFLGEFYDFPSKTMAIGRLDKKSEGLLLLTTNGKTSDYINTQSIEKEYYVQVDGLITNDAIELLRAGLKINVEGVSYKTKPCKAHIINPKSKLPKRKKRIRDDRHGPTSWLSIILTEGKFHQVRKMTAAVGFPTLRLIRYRVGKYNIDTLNSGEVIEVDSLY